MQITDARTSEEWIITDVQGDGRFNTGNVDSEQGARLGRLFLELNKIGTTVVIATHDERMIERFGQPVLRLEEGELRMESAPATGAR